MRRFILIILLLFSLKASATIDSSRVIHYTIDNILPSNHVYCIMQDKDGYMWFGTDNGLVKYNGYTAKVFTTADGLPSNDIWELYEDKSGRIWIFTYASGIGYIQDDKYHQVISVKWGVTHIYQFNENDSAFNIIYDNQSSTYLN